MKAELPKFLISCLQRLPKGLFGSVPLTGRLIRLKL